MKTIRPLQEAENWFLWIFFKNSGGFFSMKEVVFQIFTLNSLFRGVKTIFWAKVVLKCRVPLTNIRRLQCANNIQYIFTTDHILNHEHECMCIVYAVFSLRFIPRKIFCTPPPQRPTLIFAKIPNWHTISLELDTSVCYWYRANALHSVKHAWCSDIFWWKIIIADRISFSMPLVSCVNIQMD